MAGGLQEKLSGKHLNTSGELDKSTHAPSFPNMVIAL